MGFDQDPTVATDDSDGHNVNGANGRGRVGEGGLALGELEPEVVDVLGAGLDTPRSKGVGGQPGLEPIGEGLGVGKVVGAAAAAAAAAAAGHGGDFEEATRAERERDEVGPGGEERGSGGGRKEEAHGQGGEEQIGQQREGVVAVGDWEVQLWWRR